MAAAQSHCEPTLAQQHQRWIHIVDGDIVLKIKKDFTFKKISNLFFFIFAIHNVDRLASNCKSCDSKS